MDTYIPTVIDAEYIKDYIIKVKFDNGKSNIVDFSKFLYGPIFEPLKEIAYFKNFFVDGWTIAWPNGADIAPETLYEYDSSELMQDLEISHV